MAMAMASWTARNGLGSSFCLLTLLKTPQCIEGKQSMSWVADLGEVLAGAGLLSMQLAGQIPLLTCQHSHLLLHAAHLAPDLLCVALKPAPCVISKPSLSRNDLSHSLINVYVD